MLAIHQGIDDRIRERGLVQQIFPTWKLPFQWDVVHFRDDLPPLGVGFGHRCPSPGLRVFGQPAGKGLSPRACAKNRESEAIFHKIVVAGRAVAQGVTTLYTSSNVVPLALLTVSRNPRSWTLLTKGASNMACEVLALVKDTVGP